MSIVHLRPLTLLLLALLLLAGCEEPFEPIVESDFVFSIYGHLDAASDTQWVRVMPLRGSLATGPGAIDAVVTLDEMETGASVVMSDSLFRYETVNFDGSVFAHNFSTTMPIVPGRHYRLTATRSDGAAASATVLIPVWESPVMTVNHTYRYPTTSDQRLVRHMSAFGTIRGTRYLAMVLGGHDSGECCEWHRPTPAEFLPVLRPAAVEGDDHGVRLSWGVPPDHIPPQLGGPLGHEDKRILAVASSEPWPYDPTLEILEVTHPAAINNIEGGFGFLAGVHTYVFPFAGCTPLERTIPCTITFGPRSATLIGVVTDGCTDGPLTDVRVGLVGLPESGTRSETTGANGKVQFHGLEPGAAHALAFEAQGFFPVNIENVVVAEAAVDTVSVVMSHRGNCVSS